MGVKIDKNILNSPKRTVVVKEIQSLSNAFTQRTDIHTYLSGLPLIRTVLAEKVKGEMKLFLLVSLLLSTVMLLLFFRSISTTILSLAVVMLGVVWTIGITEVCGYQITLLTALIPSLVVVIGIPNCIYFINKYHIYIQQGYGQHDAIETQPDMAAGHLDVFMQGRIAINGGLLRWHHAIRQGIQATGGNGQTAAFAHHLDLGLHHVRARAQPVGHQAV